MSILEFIVYVVNLHKRGDFWGKFIKHFGRRSWSPARVKTHDEHDSEWPEDEASMCKSLGTQPENSEAWMARIQALTVKETMSKAHMQVHTNKESREKQPGRRPGPNWAEMGLGRPAQPILCPVRCPLWPSCPSDYLLRPCQEPRKNTFFIRRRGAEKRRTPSQRGEGRDGWLGFP
jgi:hypothetical protein